MRPDRVPGLLILAAFAAFILPSSAAAAAHPWRLIWSTSLDWPGLHVKGVAPSGCVYLKSPEWLIGLSPEGSLNWKHDLTKAPKDLAIGPEGNVYVAESLGIEQDPLPQFPSSGQADCLGVTYSAITRVSAFRHGGRLWSRSFRDPVGSTNDSVPSLVLTAWTGGVYLGRDEILCSLDPRGGVVFENTDLYRLGWPTIQVAPDGTIYSSDSAVHCICIDKTGHYLWGHNLQAYAGSAGEQAYWLQLLPGRMAVYSVPERGELIAYAADTGHLLWETRLSWLSSGKAGKWPGPVQPPYDPYLDEPITVHHGGTISQTTRRNLMWKPEGPALGLGPPALAEDGTVYVTEQGRKLFALDSTGLKTWSFQTKLNKEAFIGWQTIGPDRQLYVATNKGLLALSLDGDYLGRDTRFSNVQATPYFVGRDAVYIISDSTLYCLATD